MEINEHAARHNEGDAVRHLDSITPVSPPHDLLAKKASY